MNRELINAAIEARRFARAPYSRFLVGAAIETRDGRVFAGANIENASYGLTVCAERVAVWNAVSQGATQFVRVAVCADTQVLTPPCGACRQVLWELCGDVPVTMANLNGVQETIPLRDLLPRAFDGSLL